MWVGFHKKDSRKKGISYQASIDEALCFGWIDGIVKRVNETSYCHRFTPRRPKSIWSLVNIRRAEKLKRLGRLLAAGLKAFAARDPHRSGIYSFENTTCKLDANSRRSFRQNKKAWTFFSSQPRGYQHAATWWVLSARKQETRLRRLARLIQDSEMGSRLKMFTAR